MIQPNELRINNCIRVYLGTSDKGPEYKEFNIHTFYENGVHVGLGKCFKFIDIEPIPLTEEWFEKFGFEKIGLYDYAMPDMSFFVYWDKINRIYLCQRCGEKIPLKYVHKLQNLYYAVKELELTIKE